MYHHIKRKWGLSSEKTHIYSLYESRESLVAPRRIATLDLRIDYVRPALPHQEVICDAHCYKVTRHVAFVRATAHHGDNASPIATASGTFVVFRDIRRDADEGSE